MKNTSRSHQDFDKIFKENLSQIIFSVTEELCGLKIEKLEDISLSLPRTKEKRPDFAKLAVNPTEKYILHFEIQTANDKEMPWRMLEYFEFFYRKYNIPVRQFLLYIGNEKLRMLPHIKLENLWFEYKIIDFRKVDYRKFINSAKPESIILAILCDYKASNPRAVIAKILENLLNAKTENLPKYVFQLKILSALRNLEEITGEEIQNMPQRFNYNLENDIQYRQGLQVGEQVGEQQGEKKAVERILEKRFGGLQDVVKQKVRQLSPDEIESLIDVLLEFDSVQDLENWIESEAKKVS